jgi:alkaline phosphatase D
MLRRNFLTLLAAALTAAAQSQRPYVLLVSLDGFRHDYAVLHGAPALEQLGREGVRAEALIPVHPTLTFPNHYSIVTGLYPGRHGIVDNNFLAPWRTQAFTMQSKESFWWGGVPLWSLAEGEGVRTAAFFWPGSEAEIAGFRPREHRAFEDTLPNQERVRQVVDWFRRPEPLRPHLVTLYFSDVDHAGHDFGPEDARTRQAVQALDATLGELLEGIRATGTPVNVFVVSDHGMVASQPPILIATEGELRGLRANVRGGSQIFLYTDDAELARATVDKLNSKAQGFRAYLREQTPEPWGYRGNRRVGEVVVVATGRAPITIDPNWRAPGGHHGLDPALGEMRGIFYAAGPDLKRGLTIPPFENVHIYPLIAKLLGLPVPPGIDGRLDVLAPILK